MRIVHSLALPLAAAVQLLAAGSASAQVSVHFHLGNLPERPRLYEVQPGVQVVEGYPDAEVFYSNGWYWCRRQDGWYRSRSPRDDFYHVRRRRVPPELVQMPMGEYRDWHHDWHHGRHEARERHEEHERWEHARHEHEEHEHGHD